MPAIFSGFSGETASAGFSVLMILAKATVVLLAALVVTRAMERGSAISRHLVWFVSLGALLMIGLFTRIVAFILSGEMAFAYFLGHMFKKPEEPVFLPLLNGGTAAILFCFACLYLATAGGGPYSVDEMRKK